MDSNPVPSTSDGWSQFPRCAPLNEAVGISDVRASALLPLSQEAVAIFRHSVVDPIAKKLDFQKGPDWIGLWAFVRDGGAQADTLGCRILLWFCVALMSSPVAYPVHSPTYLTTVVDTVHVQPRQRDVSKMYSSVTRVENVITATRHDKVS